MQGELNWTVVLVVALAFVAVMFLIWRGTHDLDFFWNHQDVRLKLTTAKRSPSPRKSRRRARRRFQ
jgi:hypothetical protein